MRHHFPQAENVQHENLTKNESNNNLILIWPEVHRLFEQASQPNFGQKTWNRCR